MKCHALALHVAGCDDGSLDLRKSPILRGFPESGGYVPANEWVEANEAKSGIVLMKLAGPVPANIEGR